MAMNFDMWHVEKTSKPNTFCLQLCILLKYYSVQKLHHNSKTIHLIRTLTDTRFTTGMAFSTQFSQGFTQFFSSSGSFLSCSSLASSWSYRTAMLHNSELVCLACTAVPLNTASSLAGLHPLLTGWELLSRAVTGNHSTCSGDIQRQHF